MIGADGDSYLEPERPSIFFENMTLDFLLLGTRLYVRREFADIIIFRSVVLIQYLNPELRITRHVPDFPKLVPHGLQCACLNGRAASRRNDIRSDTSADGNNQRWGSPTGTVQPLSSNSKIGVEQTDGRK